MLVEVMYSVLVVETVPARRSVEVPQVIEDQVTVGGEVTKGGIELFPGLTVGQEGLTLAPGVDQFTVVAGDDVCRQRWPVFVVRNGNEKDISLGVVLGHEVGVVAGADGAGRIAGDELRDLFGHPRTTRGDPVESSVTPAIAETEDVKGL